MYHHPGLRVSLDLVDIIHPGDYLLGAFPLWLELRRRSSLRFPFLESCGIGQTVVGSFILFVVISDVNEHVDVCNVADPRGPPCRS